MKKDEPFRMSAPPMGCVHPSSTLIIGLGNPILGDDGVGWKVAEELARTVSISPSIVIETASLGGLSLMERLIGFQRAIIIDSMETSQSQVGTVRVIPLDGLSNPCAGHSASAHDTSLLTALQTAKYLGLPVPESIVVVAIEAKNVYDFSDVLSPLVAAAIPLACQTALNLLQKEVA